ncbi:hypothetical protein OIU84_019422 [Salix udensis]|uniref:Uncharacterized protein n=1 Tax=Salix udensis TaxID=889485 RepID=A0AAD6KYU8_9ROSI|nr:hypothetical protein OIU84_019422 [Salix udensis]
MSLSFSSSLLSSPLTHNKNKTHQQLKQNQNPIHTHKLLLRCAFSSAATAPPSSTVPKKKHWKQGEFPGFTDDSRPRRTPIKNIKKKLDRKSKGQGLGQHCS